MKREIIAGVMFVVGAATTIAGLIITLAREYYETLRLLSIHSTKLSGKAIAEDVLAPHPRWRFQATRFGYAVSRYGGRRGSLSVHSWNRHGSVRLPDDHFWAMKPAKC